MEFKHGSLTIYRVGSAIGNQITLANGNKLGLIGVKAYDYAISTGFAELDEYFGLQSGVNVLKDINYFDYLTDNRDVIHNIKHLDREKYAQTESQNHTYCILFCNNIIVVTKLGRYEMPIDVESYERIQDVIAGFDKPPFNGETIVIDKDDYTIYCYCSGERIIINIISKTMHFHITSDAKSFYGVNISTVDHLYELINKIQEVIKDIRIYYLAQINGVEYQITIPTADRDAKFIICYKDLKSAKKLSLNDLNKYLLILLPTGDLAKAVTKVEPIQAIKSSAKK